MTQRRQLPQHAGEADDVGPLTRSLIQSDGFMRPPGEYGADQPAKRCAGADLDERAHAGGVEILDLADELDRPGQLLGQ